jgi:hypothetical protein
MATADDIAEGFYRYPDLKAKKYVSSSRDLHDKQKKLGFPLPAKPSPKVALFLKAEVHAWWLDVLAKRDAQHRNASNERPALDTEQGVENISDGRASC